MSNDTGFVAENGKDYGKATDIGFRWDNSAGTLAAVRIYKDDDATMVAQKLRALAHSIEQVKLRVIAEPYNNQIQRAP